MPIMLSESEGLGAAFATLVCFFLATVAFAYNQRSKSYDVDTYMVARNTQGVLSLTLSFFRAAPARGSSLPCPRRPSSEGRSRSLATLSRASSL